MISLPTVRRSFPLILFALTLLAGAADGQAPATGAGRSASELLGAGEAAYNAGKWQEASGIFDEFIKNFGGLEGTAGAVGKVKPLLAICWVRLGEFEKALPLLDAALQAKDLAASQRVDLEFFTGLANLRTGKPDAARKNLGAIFGDLTVEKSRRMEALILGGMSYVMEQNWKESAAFFRKHGEEIRGHSPEAGARAEILLLHALMKEQQWDEAVAVAGKIHASLGQTRQVVTFSSMLIELGGHFLEANESHKAISVLRQVPSKITIERLQNARLAESEGDLKTQGGNAVRASQIQSGIDEMRRELEAFAKIPQFDSAARLRLASAYFQLGRTREACLILDQMVRQMEPDAIVESATASLIRGWMSLERYSRAARTADLYMERCADLPETPNLPEVAFLKAQALEGQFQYQAAADGFLAVAEAHKANPIAPRARFMAAYNVLQLENYDAAGAMLEKQEKELKKSDEMWAHVVFWRAMAFYFDQKWDDARKQLERYLTESADEKTEGEYVDDAKFRIGYSYFSEARYPEAIKTLTKFTTDYPQSEWRAEALLTLGDSQAAEGELDRADSAYSQIGKEAAGFHDEGWMKRGNLYKVKKDLPGMKAVFTEFLAKRPDSPRISEALQWLGWVAKQEGMVPEARAIYWDAITRFGNDTARPGLEEIFLALLTFYSGPDKPELEAKLNDALALARSEKKLRMATRLGWALAQLRQSSGLTPEGRAAGYRESLVALAADLDPKETAPRILADAGDALRENGDFEKAAAVYEGLRKWWPRSPERDRAYAGLGFIAVRANDEPGALKQFDRFEKSSVMARTAPDDKGIVLVEGEIGGKVAIARARLLAVREPGQALDLLLAVQRTKSMPARIRAEAFLDAARLHVARERFREALPYFEQVYLLFNRFPELVASAYLERGETLEKLKMADKAREVYSELASREDLSGFEQSKLGRRRAESLGGVILPKEPEGGLIPPAPAVR